MGVETHTHTHTHRLCVNNKPQFNEFAMKVWMRFPQDSRTSFHRVQ